MRLERLYNEINFLPDVFKKHVCNFYKNKDALLAHIENDLVPNTNNFVEGYYKLTFPRKIKKIFRTLKGAKIRISLNKIHWYKNTTLKGKI